MICHDFQTVFIHIPKTAGQSVEQIFLEEIGLSWENRLPLLLTYNSNSKVGPPRLAHLTRNDYLDNKYISYELWQTYFTFTFVRNPWDRAVSFYKYLDPKRRNSFSQFLKKKLSADLWTDKHWFVKPQYEFIKDSENSTDINFIGTFENLGQDFLEVAKVLGLTRQALPRANPSYLAGSKNRKRFLKRAKAGIKERWYGNHKKQTYRDYFGATEKRIIEQLYEVDIDAFGYKF